MRRGHGGAIIDSDDNAANGLLQPSPRVTRFQRLRRHLAAPLVRLTSKASPMLRNATAARRRRSCSWCAVVCVVAALAGVVWLLHAAMRRPVVLDVAVERLPLPSVETPQAAVIMLPAQLSKLHGNPVALVVPLIGSPVSTASGNQLLRELLSPLLVSETALCYRADDGAAVPAVVHAVVMSRVSAAALRAAVRGVVAAGTAADGVAVSDGGAGAALTPGARWRAWELSAAAVRRLLGLAGGGDGGCLADAVTVVGHAMGGDGAVYTEEPAETLEVLVDAALRTRGGSVGTHFIVLPSILAASRMAYTEPDDAAEVRRGGTGLVDALLRTATGRNAGRVAAAQCTILGAAASVGETPPAVFGSVPPVLTMKMLKRLQVLDKGAMVGSTHHYMILMPFLARRRSGHLAVDQRASWEEVVDAVSLHCGIFHRALYDAVGGFAGALSVDGASSTFSRLPDHLLAASDRGGWALSLRMQEMDPTWQVWGSRGVAVLRDDVSGVRDSPSKSHLYEALYSIRDDYGRRLSPLLVGLQRRRVNVPWLTRQTALRTWNSTAVPQHFPAVILYGTDFTDPCCGLNREAMSYIRPLIERYSVRTRTANNVCPKPGDAVLSTAYHTDKFRRVLSRFAASRAAEDFWRDALQQRAHIDFWHMRPIAFNKTHKTVQKGVGGITVSRSLSELSNIPDEWVSPMQQYVDEVWVTADFFASIYRRRGINPGKVRVVPEAVDVYDYDPANYERLPVTLDAGGNADTGFDSQPGLTAAQRVQRYVFFANFKWEDRKGWDVLLGAYWDAFGPHAPPELRGRTTLVIKTKFEPFWTRGVTCANVVRFIEAWGLLGSLRGMRTIDDYPHVVVLCAAMSSAQLTQLYASADAFVFASKAEGWGLPATEAMAMGLPVLVTDWGGLRHFTTPDTCFRIPLDGLEEIEPGSPYGHAEGMKMAVPSRDKTAELMRYVLQHPDHARRVGRRARALMVREMSEEAVADTMDRLFVEAIERRLVV